MRISKLPECFLSHFPKYYLFFQTLKLDPRENKVVFRMEPGIRVNCSRKLHFLILKKIQTKMFIAILLVNRILEAMLEASQNLDLLVYLGSIVTLTKVYVHRVQGSGRLLNPSGWNACSMKLSLWRWQWG